jgi:DNA uptake protein ComE-like DNA-binding protein
MAKHLPISFILVTDMTRKIIPNSQSAICNPKSAIRNGSAIILAIVLTTLLAILGVLFLLSSRVDSVATSGVGDNQDLKLAVDTVVSQISQNLANGVPGVVIDPCLPPPAYYDYPDPCTDFWLACLEPYNSGTGYRWRHVTDLYNNFGSSANNIIADITPEYQPAITPYNTLADADGDGVSDSIWVQVPGKASSKGKPIYAAIRIIDNGGMLNINTAYKFAPNYSVGSTQLDINLMALAWHPSFPYNPTAENILLLTRDPFVSGLANYENNVIWRYGLPNGAYTPFDISDELELRYRFLVNQEDIDTRAEVLPLWELRTTSNLRSPADSGQLDKWFINVSPDTVFDVNYAYRHIATTYNCDRIINPAGNKMLNINSPLKFDKNSIYNAVREALDPNVFSSIDVAQITANLMDYIDGPNYPSTDPRYDPNNEVTGVPDPCTGTLYYGFERPCVYISEIAQNFYQPDINEPNILRSYAIELFKPYWEDDEPNGWQIITEGLDSGGNPLPPNTTTIVWTGSRRFHVLTNINTTFQEVNIPVDFNDMPGPNDFNGFDPGKFNHQPQMADINFAGGTDIILQRNVNGIWLQVDKFLVPGSEVNGSDWLVPKTVGYASHSFERDITTNKCIRKILNPNMTTPTIGGMNHPFNSGGDMIQAHPANKMFTNIGEIGQLFRTDAYLTGLPGMPDDEASVRLNIADANFQNLFRYLTVMDPCDHSQPAAETKIKGRININTAPWFVLAQLPWVSYHTQPNYDLARSIVNNRDTYGAFKSTGELMRVGIGNNDVNSIGYYEGKGTAIPTTLLTPTDGVGDAFEERDVIFDRISNLITVRSDVFTAYILVRIGTDGPQKRVIAILDRSGVTPTAGSYTGKVKVIAVQQVPDPR